MNPRLDPSDLTPDEVRSLDASYRTFAPLSDWTSARATFEVWDRYRSRLEEERSLSASGSVLAATEAAMRAAAFSTGAIEGLYAPDRGFTITIAETAAGWQATLADLQDQRSVDLVEAALEGYHYALDAATSSTPITEKWIREVHAVVCAPQATYTVITAAGPQARELPRGTYKSDPNHVRKADGTFHSYSPVDDVPSEMARLVDVIRSPEFGAAHPVVQAAFSHHALATIHPFADGNGRVARVLSSVFLFRAASIPFVVFHDERSMYLDSLSAADLGDRVSFSEFVEARAIDTMAYGIERLCGSIATDVATEGLASVLAAQERVSSVDLDLVIDRIERELESKVRDRVRAVAPGLPDRVSLDAALFGPPSENPPSHREPRQSGARRYVQARVSALGLSTTVGVTSYIALNERVAFPLLLKRTDTGDESEFRVSDVHPRLSSAAELRLSAIAERLVADALRQLQEQVDASSP